jgi:hypothetical protein
MKCKDETILACYILNRCYIPQRKVPFPYETTNLTSFTVSFLAIHRIKNYYQVIVSD